MSEPLCQVNRQTRRCSAQRDKILAAARAAFADTDALVSMAEISRRARVGDGDSVPQLPQPAKNYSRRSTTDEVNAVCEAAGTVEGETPGAALTAWLAPVLRVLQQQTPRRRRAAQANPTRASPSCTKAAAGCSRPADRCSSPHNVPTKSAG